VEKKHGEGGMRGGAGGRAGESSFRWAAGPRRPEGDKELLCDLVRKRGGKPVRMETNAQKVMEEN